MARSNHVKLLRGSVARWNKWRVRRDKRAWKEGRFGKGDFKLDLSGADLRDLDLRGANLARVNARGANLAKANLDGAVLTAADFSAANLAKAQIIFAKLHGTNFTGADLSEARFHNSYILACSFKSANLYHAGFGQARVDLTNFEGADLRKVNFAEAFFVNGSFNNADLSEAIFQLSVFKTMKFAQTQLARAWFGATVIAGADLSETRGLELARHRYPSYIDVDTIYKSRGKIPKTFLSEAGIPNGLVDYIPSLIDAADGFQFYSCFISHSHKDEEFCRHLRERMRGEQLRVYFAPEDMEGGKKIDKQLETQIQLHDKLLLVLSEHSMKSSWVATEIYLAKQRERKEGRQILFPIAVCPYDKIREWRLFDSDSGEDMAREIRAYFIPDFADWKNRDAFDSAFVRLVQSLRAADKRHDPHCQQECQQENP